MNIARTTVALSLLAAAAVTLHACSSPGPDRENGIVRGLPDGQISVTGAWARPSVRSMTSGAYLTLHNRKAAADTLTGARTPAASRADLHQSFSSEGISGMRPAGPLPIPAGDSLSLAPGGYHLMLMRMERSTETGDTLELDLHFASGDTLRVRLPVKMSGGS